jgi:molybdopterin-containing oxidoreductase family molybdopterin binding subunit
MSFARPVRKALGVKVVRTASAFDCGPACGILAHVKDGILVKVEPGDFAGTGHICARGLAALKMVYHPERLKRPMKRLGERGDGKWQEISWEEALSTIAAKLRQISDRYGSNSLAWTADMMGALTTSAVMGFAGACQGTFILPAGYGDSSGLCADATLYSTPMYYGESYTVQFDNPALCVVWGSNPAETECFKWRRIRDFKERGARLVVVDPRFTTTASKADEYIPIRPGTDAALALGMMNVILDRGLQDTSFMIDYTVGPFLVRSDSGMFLREKDVSLVESEKYIVWDPQRSIPRRYDVPEVAPALAGVYKVKGVDCKPAFQLLADLVRQYPPDVASEITGVSADTIARLAIEYATKKPVASFRGMGGTRGNLYGDLNFRAISTLAALTGNISFEGRASFGTNYFALMSRGIPSFMPVLQMHEAILTGKPYPIKALWMVRINLINADPDFNKMIKEIIPRLELIVVADMFMSTSAQYADIVLPACSFYECTDLLSPIGFGSHNYL